MVVDFPDWEVGEVLSSHLCFGAVLLEASGAAPVSLERDVSEGSSLKGLSAPV